MREKLEQLRALEAGMSIAVARVGQRAAQRRYSGRSRKSAHAIGQEDIVMSGPAISKARRVAFQGEPGAYANLAAREALPHAQYIPCPTFDQAVEAVKQGETDLCIIPVENSLMGRNRGHPSSPARGRPSHRRRATSCASAHQLLGLKGAPLGGLKSVYSQGPALAQCLKVIRELKLKAENWHDTAGSAQARRSDRLQDPTAPRRSPRACGRAASSTASSVLKADVEDRRITTHTRFPSSCRASSTSRPMTAGGSLRPSCSA
ncbi:MAG: prephenate dehydratase domain-containing protein [Rhizomicrobium sp.]